MEDFLNIALVQTDLYWEDIPANLGDLEEKLAGLQSGLDLIILPEMFSTGFSMQPERISQPPGLTIMRWMSQMSARTGAVIIGSFAASEQGNYYNRLVAMAPDGGYEYYDKRHLFRMAGEHEVYTGGDRKLFISVKGWKICPLICYDLRFPVWSRNPATAPYDLLVYVANWPAARSYAWDTLLKARAIENLSYVAGVNRTGTDGKGVAHSGGSALIDFQGRPLLSTGKEAGVEIIKISKKELLLFREQFPALSDADSFEVRD